MAARRAAKEPPPGRWQYTVGEPPLQLTAFERTDRRLAIYTRVWNGRCYTRKKSLCPSIRDSALRVVPERELEAQRLALARHSSLTAGLTEDEVITGSLTLGQGFRRVLHDTEGKYPADSRQKGDVERAAKVILKVLGADLRWSQLKHAHYRKLWRFMAAENRRSGRFGHRQAEVVVEALASSARWLQQEGLIESGEAEPARGWKGAMKGEWVEITGRPIPQRRKPRYTPAEIEALWQALPRADPRLRLAVEIGAELRLGQVVRIRRSDIHPSPDGAEPLWSVTVHGRGKKLGETVVLTGDQREVLRHALREGYLAELEAARRTGRIEDYHLMPAGMLVTRKLHGERIRRARPDRANAHLRETGLRKQWAELERLAGVMSVPGRKWYGVRRRQADAADELEVRATVKNRVGGWSKTSTREGYLEQGRMEDAVDAAEVRRRIRPTRTEAT